MANVRASENTKEFLMSGGKKKMSHYFRNDTARCFVRGFLRNVLCLHGGSALAALGSCFSCVRSCGW